MPSQGSACSRCEKPAAFLIKIPCSDSPEFLSCAEHWEEVKDKKNIWGGKVYELLGSYPQKQKAELLAFNTKFYSTIELPIHLL